MSAPTPTSSSAEQTRRSQRLVVGVVLWIYGISITVFLFSIWGRSVAADTGLLAEAAANTVESDFVSSRVEDWFGGLVDEPGPDGSATQDVGSVIAALPEVKEATSDVVTRLVLSLASPAEGPIVVDVADAYRPAVPAVAAGVQAAGVSVSEAEVAAVVEGLEPLVLGPGGSEPAVGPESRTARTLTVATLVGLGLMIVSGSTAVYLADDRGVMMRTLLTRLAVSAFSFAVFFRVSSWVVDPGGGRAGVGGALAEVLGSKLWIPLLITAAAGAGGWAVRHRKLIPRQGAEES